jgi:hypothetical protein
MTHLLKIGVLIVSALISGVAVAAACVPSPPADEVDTAILEPDQAQNQTTLSSCTWLESAELTSGLRQNRPWIFVDLRPSNDGSTLDFPTQLARMPWTLAQLAERGSKSSSYVVFDQGLDDQALMRQCQHTSGLGEHVLLLRGGALTLAKHAGLFLNPRERSVSAAQIAAAKNSIVIARGDLCESDIHLLQNAGFLIETPSNAGTHVALSAVPQASAIAKPRVLLGTEIANTADFASMATVRQIQFELDRAAKVKAARDYIEHQPCYLR